MEKEEWDKDKNKMISTGENEKVNNATALWTRAKIKLKKISMKSLQVVIL